MSLNAYLNLRPWARRLVDLRLGWLLLVGLGADASGRIPGRRVDRCLERAVADHARHGFQLAQPARGCFVSADRGCGVTNHNTIIQLALKAGAAEFYPERQSSKDDTYLVGSQFLERFAQLVAEAEREACAQACDAQRDLREEARSALRVADSLANGDQDDQLRALRHDSDVRLYHCGIDKCVAAIRVRGTQ